MEAGKVEHVYIKEYDMIQRTPASHFVLRVNIKVELTHDSKANTHTHTHYVERADL